VKISRDADHSGRDRRSGLRFAFREKLRKTQEDSKKFGMVVLTIFEKDLREYLPKDNERGVRRMTELVWRAGLVLEKETPG